VRVTVHELPADLPGPVDDGACDHLEGMEVPARMLESSAGPVDLAAFGAERGILYVYPRTGRPDRPVPAGWDAIPGARGCTPESCGFRDHSQELRALGAKLAGLSSQTLEEQVELSQRLGILYPVISDPDLALRDALALPTFEFEGQTLYKRLTLVFEAGHVAKCFYPVFPPDRHAEEVVAWLAS
jgi:peroxiredoxin